MMKKTMVAVAALLAAMFAFAQDAEIVKVRGKGVGADKTEALKDAYRDAVERAVGLYVDAEQMMKNEELVKDQILTQSNAYIEKYDVAKETTKPNGLVEVQILAEVRKAALTKKISDVMPTKTFRLSDGLKNEHAKITTVEKRNVDGATLLKKALEGLNPMFEITDCELACPDGFIREKREGWHPQHTVSVSYLFKTSINQKRLFENVVPKLKGVLEQISLTKPRNVTIPVPIGDPVDVNAMVDTRRKDPNVHPRSRTYKYRGACNAHVDFHGKVDSKSPHNFMALVNGGNKFKTAYTGIVYELDDASAKVLADWYSRMIARIGRREFKVSFLDSSGDIIFCGNVTDEYFGNCVSESPIIIAPWLWLRSSTMNNDRIVFEQYFWREFDIPKDAMPEIENLKIEIVK